MTETIRELKTGRRRFMVRWKVDGAPEKTATFATKRAARAHQARLFAAVSAGELFDRDTREPVSWKTTDTGPSIAEYTQTWMATKWGTAYEVGTRNGDVQGGDTVVIVGAGPIGLAAIATSRLLSPLRIGVVDPAERRRKAALDLGADVTFATAAEARSWVADTTAGLGAEVVIEAVGVPETFTLCAELVRPGGHVANIGVHGSSAELHLETLWDKDVTITTGLVDTSSTPTLLRLRAVLAPWRRL